MASVGTSAAIGARLDRLPITRLHRKVFGLVAIGMFFEGFDIYIAASVLGSAFKSGFSTLAQNGLVHFGNVYRNDPRCSSHGTLGRQVRPAFYLSSQSHAVRRCVAGLGICAEHGSAHCAAFRDGAWPRCRECRRIFHHDGIFPGQGQRPMVRDDLHPGDGRSAVSALLAWLLVPAFGWRVMFVLGGVGALIAWFLRREFAGVPSLAGIGRARSGGGCPGRRFRARGFASRRADDVPIRCPSLSCRWQRAVFSASRSCRGLS